MGSGLKSKLMRYYQGILFPLVCHIVSLAHFAFTHTISSARQPQGETTVPADIILVHGTCIVNEAMLSGESTPLLKESIQVLDGSENLDVDGTHKNAILFSGTKVLQASTASTFAFYPYLMHVLS